MSKHIRVQVALFVAALGATTSSGLAQSPTYSLDNLLVGFSQDEERSAFHRLFTRLTDEPSPARSDDPRTWERRAMSLQDALVCLPQDPPPAR
jgi:hypothetical protein